MIKKPSRETLENICQKLSQALSDKAAEIFPTACLERFSDQKAQCQIQFKKILEQALDKLDIVSKTHFDQQASQLKSLQEKLNELEARLKNLE